MANNTTGIQKRQNETEMQSLIVTQHFTYKSAKKLSLLVFLISVIVPIGINVAFYFSPSDIVSGVLAIIAISIVLIGDLISSEIGRLKKRAAMIQQKFDLYVFDLDIKSNIDDSIIAEQQEKFKNRDWYRKENWYSNIKSIEKEKAIIYSQCENLDWTGNVAKRYQHFILFIAFFAMLFFVVNMVINNGSVVKMLQILLTAIPLISHTKSSYLKIRHDNEILMHMRDFTQEIQTNLESLDLEHLYNYIYILQTQIYRFRQDMFLVPDWFEKLQRKELQAVENRKAAIRTRFGKKRKSANK